MLRSIPLAMLLTAFCCSTAYCQRAGRPTTGQNQTPNQMGNPQQGQAGALGDAAASPLADLGLDQAFQIDRGPTIGRSAADITGFGNIGQQGAFGAGAGGLGGYGGGFGGGFGMGGLGLGGFGMGSMGVGGQRFGQTGQQDQQPPIRTRLVADLDVARPTTSQRANAIRDHLQDLPNYDRFTGVDLEVEGRTATLSGSVESERDRRLIEGLIRLEPGISEIENNVRVVTLEQIPAGVPNGD